MRPKDIQAMSKTRPLEKKLYTNNKVGRSKKLESPTKEKENGVGKRNMVDMWEKGVIFDEFLPRDRPQECAHAVNTINSDRMDMTEVRKASFEGNMVGT